MPQRNEKLVTGNIYHVLNKSIAGFQIFNSPYEYQRMLMAIRYYRHQNPVYALSEFLKTRRNKQNLEEPIILQEEKIVEIVAYCLMPTHIHLVLKQLSQNGIQNYIHKCLNSYSHYFNLKYKRKGPLWQNRFRSILVETDEQLLHLTRYVHLNPTTASLVSKPELWESSSYGEYIQPENSRSGPGLCCWQQEIDMTQETYKLFVNDHIDYQRELSKIKHLLIE